MHNSGGNWGRVGSTAASQVVPYFLLIVAPNVRGQQPSSGQQPARCGMRAAKKKKAFLATNDRLVAVSHSNRHTAADHPRSPL